MNSSFCTIKKGTGPVIAVANHHGHALRPEVARLMALDAAIQRELASTLPGLKEELEKMRAQH